MVFFMGPGEVRCVKGVKMGDVNLVDLLGRGGGAHIIGSLINPPKPPKLDTSLATPPTAPTVDIAAAAVDKAEREQAKRRSRAIVQTVLGAPGGGLGAPSVQRPVLTALGG